MRLLRGRGIDCGDLERAESIVVVNEALVYVLAAARPPMLYMPMSIVGGPDMPVLAGPNVAIMSYVVRSRTSPPARGSPPPAPCVR